MARKERFPEGCATESVPNYGNPYEAPCGSEGSGNIGQVDAEIAASENSYAPVRKCIKLNWDSQDGFSVPLRVLPASNISQSARKDLVLRLRQELDQIRIFQKRVESQWTNGVILSSSSNNIPCRINGQNGSPAEDAKKSSLFTSGQGAKSVPAGNKGRGLKQGSLGKFESGKRPLALGTMNTVLMKQCETLLGRLMSHQFGWVFENPVDVVKLNIPDYLTIIKHPMDLGSIKKKIASGLYSTPLDFLADVRLTFSNAMTYNPRGHDVHFMAQTLSKFFEVRWKAIEKKIPVNNDKVRPPKPDVCRELDTSKLMVSSVKRKIISEEQDYTPNNVKRKMTDQEKHDLGRELEALLGEMPVHIVDFLREHSSSGRDTGEDEIEIDIDDLSDDTLFTLRKLLDNYLKDKQKNSRKAEPCEIEMPNKSGLSTSSLQLCKDNSADEDVDIGGREPPVSSYPTVEMVKDTDCRTSKCISLDGPGGDSDSNSSSSNESEMDGVKASASENVSMNKLIAGSDIDKNAITDNALSGNQSVSCLDQTELTSPHNPISVDSKFHQDGENSQPERQVSPSKLYRAALLKNRFADTILKAQEKTLKQGEKGNLERLHREREELEMQRKKEKARLQAEAKVAEDARRKAEAEAAAAAAAEARRMRELEREAAREALQKMEKTVEISENGRFIEDLERLSAAPADHFTSSVDEISPDHCLEALGSFNFRGSRTLEKLGLYMKMDEEEEEGEPPASSNTLDDMEEGEID